MFYSQDQVAALCRVTVQEFLRHIAHAGFSVNQAARLAGVTRLTINTWRKEPPAQLRVGAFLNVMAANKWMQAGRGAGHLPARDKHAANYYMDRLERGIKEWPEDGQKEAPAEGGEGPEEETAHHA